LTLQTRVLSTLRLLLIAGGALLLVLLPLRRAVVCPHHDRHGLWRHVSITFHCCDVWRLAAAAAQAGGVGPSHGLFAAVVAVAANAAHVPEIAGFVPALLI